MEWYETRGGNPFGVPVVHIGVNLQPFTDAATDAFVHTYGLGIVADDYNAAGQHQVRPLYFPNTQPLFAVISGVAGSPTHQQWELIISRSSYGQTDFTAVLAQWRAFIDTVRPPPRAPVLGIPSIGMDGSVSFLVEGESGCSYAIQVSTDFVTWNSVATVSTTTGSALFTDGEAGDSPRGFYRAVKVE